MIGGSGSGKSTLLRCIDLLEEIDDGDIYLDGQQITVLGINPVPTRRRLGLVFQAFNLFPHRRVLDNVIMDRGSRPSACRCGRHASADSRCLSGSGWATVEKTSRTSSRVASSNGWRSPARS